MFLQLWPPADMFRFIITDGNSVSVQDLRLISTELQSAPQQGRGWRRQGDVDIDRLRPGYGRMWCPSPLPGKSPFDIGVEWLIACTSGENMSVASLPEKYRWYRNPILVMNVNWGRRRSVWAQAQGIRQVVVGGSMLRVESLEEVPIYRVSMIIMSKAPKYSAHIPQSSDEGVYPT